MGNSNETGISPGARSPEINAAVFCALIYFSLDLTEILLFHLCVCVCVCVCVCNVCNVCVCIYIYMYSVYRYIVQYMVAIYLQYKPNLSLSGERSL